MNIYIEKSDECRNLSSLSYSQKQVCWYKKIQNVVKWSGVKGALKSVGKFYNSTPEFSSGCHDVMHLVGDSAYREFKKGKSFELTQETIICGYGFYHGFIEALLYTTGDYEEVKDFCESVNENIGGNIESSNAIYSCYHGIGHSTLDAHNPSLWGSVEDMVDPAIRICENVAKDVSEEKRKQCVTGVYNALGIALGNGLYDLKFNEDDPVYMCRNKPILYGRSCYAEVSMAWISHSMGNYNFSFQDGADFISSIGDIEGEKSTMFAFSSEFTRLNSDRLTNSELIKNCKSTRNDLFGSCLEGIELGFFNWGTPGKEYERIIPFCGDDELKSSEKEMCFNYVFRQFPTVYSRDKRLEICNTKVPDTWVDKCINLP